MFRIVLRCGPTPHNGNDRTWHIESMWFLHGVPLHSLSRKRNSLAHRLVCWVGAISLHCALSLTPLRLGIRALSIEAAKDLLAIKLDICEVEIGRLQAATKPLLLHRYTIVFLFFHLTSHFCYLSTSFSSDRRQHLDMSGAFNYPREEHHVVLNVDDEVDVSWWSTLANTLVIQCYEGGDIEAGQEESKIYYRFSYHRGSANMQ